MKTMVRRALVLSGVAAAMALGAALPATAAQMAVSRWECMYSGGTVAPSPYAGRFGYSGWLCFGGPYHGMPVY